jgi:hypothetical protein
MRNELMLRRLAVHHCEIANVLRVLLLNVFDLDEAVSYPRYPILPKQIVSLPHPIGVPTLAE